MKHHRIPKSSKHRKFKRFARCESEDDDDEPVIPHDKRKRRKLQLRVERLKEQRVPRKMQAITDYKSIPDADPDDEEKIKKKEKKKQPALLRIRTTADGDADGATRGLKPLPDFIEQGRYESEEQFLNRISRISAEARAEAKLEDHFGLDFCPVIQPQVMSTRSGTAVQAGKKGRRRKGLSQEERAEARRVKRRARDSRRRSKKKRGAKSAGLADDFDHFHDEVRFGDVVMAPPAFSKRKIKF